MMKKTYKIVDETISFTVGYDDKFLRDIRLVPGRKWDKKSKNWIVPITFSNINDVVNVIDKHKIVDEDGQDSIRKMVVSKTSIENSYENLKNIIIDYYKNKDIPIKPLPFQYNAIAFSLFTKKFINGSDMGTGKTFMSIFAVEYANLFPCIVFAPISVHYNWKEKWQMVFPDRKISVIGSKTFNPNDDVIIMGYQFAKTTKTEKGKDIIEFKYDFLNTIKFKCIVVDEVHKIKNSKTLRSKAIKKIAKGVEYFFALTGTPVMNRPSELINPLSIIGVFEKLFTSYNYFVLRYCDAKYTRFGIDTSGYSNLIELNFILSQNCYFRVEKREVIGDLPELIENIVKVDINNWKEYKKAEMDVVSYLHEKYGEERSMSASNAEVLVQFNVLQELTVEGKLELLIDWLEDFKESSTDKMVIFGIRTRPIKLLAKYFECDFITGEVNSSKRQSIIEDFQVNNKQFLFMNIETGSVGIDGLQNVCSDLLLYEVPWVWGDIDQAVSRLERIGAKKSITVNYFLAKDTIDDFKFQLVMNKRIVTDQGNRGINNTTVIKDLLNSYLK